MRGDLTDPYRTPEWFESLKWQHRWVEFMVGWWVGQYGVPRVVMDFGAGDGWWPRSFSQIGTEWPYGIELDPIARDFIPEVVNLYIHDLRTPFIEQGATDLSVCIEVAEHMSKRQAENALVPSIVKHSGKLILFSAAQPGQSGTGHINLQPQSYWIEVFQKWPHVQFSPHYTKAVKQAFENILPEDYMFLPRNLLIFSRV